MQGLYLYVERYSWGRAKVICWSLIKSIRLKQIISTLSVITRVLTLQRKSV